MYCLPPVAITAKASLLAVFVAIVRAIVLDNLKKSNPFKKRAKSEDLAHFSNDTSAHLVQGSEYITYPAAVKTAKTGNTRARMRQSAGGLV